MKIRTTISVYLGSFILIVICTIFFLNYYLVRRALTENAQMELVKTQQNMHRAAQVLLSTAISNYLRGITEKNIDFIESRYAEYVAGHLTREELKRRVQSHFNLQNVGTSGYLVAVEEKDGRLYLDLHPYLAKSDCTDTEGCRAWAEVRNGYTEYDWKNPLDNSYRKKAAYVQEFAPMDWIIGASSYRNEFVNLVKVEDLRKLISPIRINSSGYFFVFDDQDTILIHPEFTSMEGRELINSRGENILELLKKSKDGYLTYLWKNPSEKEEKKKYAFIDKLEGYNWYLVATGYLSEVYQPIEFLKNLTMLLVLLTVGFLVGIIFRLSSKISLPLQHLRKAIDRFYAEKSPFHWRNHPIEEINVLGGAFAQMTEELNLSMTELREKNTKLAVSEGRNKDNRLYLDSIINSMPSVIIGVDADCKVTQWNSQAAGVTGIQQNKALGQELIAVFGDLEECKEILVESLATNTTKTHVYTRIDGHGKLCYYEVTVYPLVNHGSRGAVIRIDEITERVELDQRLRHSQKMDAVGQLAGGIAHDFNNMLSGITGAADLLQTRVPPQDQKLVKIISEASARTAELIQKLLTFSRKENIAFAPVNIHTIILNTCDILKRSLDKRITLETRMQAETTMVYGDWSQLQNSLLNIGINGGHAMPDGGLLTFSTANIALQEGKAIEESIELPAGRYVQVEVSDTGCGITEENLKHIFEPFFTTRKHSEGTGLGLAAVYSAMQQHGGAITVRSELDQGSRFTILLPCIEAEDQIVADEPKVQTGEGCVLIIDDEPVVRMTAEMMLENLGYQTFQAENGEEGLKIYRQHSHKIDLVLLDMIMPVMDGTQCFYELKKLNPDVKVVISSGFTRDADLGNLKEAGLSDFIRKPFNMERLSRVMARLIKNTG